MSSARLPEHPTTALPGTEAKLVVMEARAERGESLFHPRDSRWDGGCAQPNGRMGTRLPGMARDDREAAA